MAPTLYHQPFSSSFSLVPRAGAFRQWHTRTRTQSVSGPKGLARGQVCVLKDLAEGQVLKSLCLWGLAEGQVCVLRTWPKAKSVSGPSLCKCRVQQCHFCAPPPQGSSSRLGVPLTPRSQFCAPPPRGTSLVVHSKAMQMP